jgi:hypothetical protein
MSQRRWKEAAVEASATVAVAVAVATAAVAVAVVVAMARYLPYRPGDKKHLMFQDVTG